MFLKFISISFHTGLHSINAFIISVKVVKDRAGFFAEQLYKSMKGMGTNDRRLIRLVVTRSEIDMGEIKEAFMDKYGKSLEDMISVSNYFQFL